MHIAVVGGGMAGLGAAWRLREAGHTVTLFDANPDLGGRCRTFQWHGRWLIRGAAAFVGAEQNLIDQAKALGIYTPAMTRDMTAQHSFDVTKNGRVHTLKQFAPADILMSSLVPATQKLSLGRVLPSLLKQMMKSGSDDPTSAVDLDTISACAYFRKYSPDFVDYILEPVMNMFCGYGEDDYSLAWLIWLMASDRAWAKSWWTFAERGVGQLSQSLETALRADPHVTVYADTRVESITGAGKHVVAFANANGSDKIEVDAVIMAVPGNAVAGMMPELDPARRAFFDGVRYVAHHIVYMLVEPPSGRHETHLMLPTKEGYQVLSNITVAPDPAGGPCFIYGEIKGSACEQMAGAADRSIIDDCLTEAVRARPDLEGCKVLDFYLQRNDVALCSRHVGYTKSLAAYRALPPLSGIAFAGDYLINSSVGSAHLSGLRAADQILAQSAA